MDIFETRKFGTLNVDFYIDNGILYITREQLGSALYYTKKSSLGIYKIHYRNKDRIDQFCKKIKNESDMYECWYYSIRGAIEICRLSGRPEAVSTMDFLLNVLECFYSKNGSNEIEQLNKRLEALEESQKKIYESTVSIREMLNSANFTCVSPTVAEQKSSPSASQESKCSNGSIVDPEVAKYINEIVYLSKQISSSAPAEYTNQNAVLHELYVNLNRTYGFVISQAKAEYRERHANGAGKISAISVIAEMPTFGSIAVNLLKEKLEEVKENQASSAAKFEIDIDKVQNIVDRVGEVLEDKTIRYSYTYRLIYQVIDMDWDEESQKFSECFGRAPTNRIEMILWKKDNFKKFQTAALSIAGVCMSGMMN